VNHSVQGRLAYHLLSKAVEIKIYEIIISPVVLYRCKSWSLILREEYILSVFENSVPKSIFGSKRLEKTV
jgi:hypothetical protein